MKKILAFSVLVPLILSSCAEIRDPDFRRLENFEIKKFGLQETTVGFYATFFNPNSFTVNVKAFDLYLDSVYVGKFNQPQPVDVNRSAEFSIPLEGGISFKTAMDLNLPRLAGKEVLINANGSVKVGKAGLYIIKAVDYKGKHILDKNLFKSSGGTGN
ncbi:MAG: hypothetical protein ABR502_11580 [Chitinophagaceae bacterium]